MTIMYYLIMVGSLSTVAMTIAAEILAIIVHISISYEKMTDTQKLELFNNSYATYKVMSACYRFSTRLEKKFPAIKTL